jgi:hypothetical protein
VRTDQTGRLRWEHADTPEVSLPVSRRQASRIDLHQRAGSAAFLNVRPFQVALAAAIALSFGGVAAVIAGNWWVFPVAASVNALGTLSAAFAVARIKATASRQWKPAPSGMPKAKPVRARLPLLTERTRARLQLAGEGIGARLRLVSESMRAHLQPASQRMRAWLQLTSDRAQKLAMASLRTLRSMLDTHTPERSRSDGSRPERSRTDTSRPERSRTDTSRPERSHTDGSRPERSRTDTSRPERSQTDRRRATPPKRAVTRY